MKIVHICLCGAMTDGFNYQENIIAKYHKKMGYEVTIIASQWIWGTDGKLMVTDKSEYYNADGIKMLRIPTKSGNVDKRLKSYPKLYDTVKSENPDILFVHDCQFLDITTLARYARSHPETRLYVDNHVDYSNGAHGWISKNILHKGLWKYCIRKIEPYVTEFYGVLPARVDFLREMYNLPPEKCKLLVMGADDELVERASAPEIKKQVREKYEIKPDDFLIMTGGKIDAWKTQTLLLMEAIQKINADNVKLIVFGSVTEELKDKVAALADGKKVQYIGWVDASQSYNLFAAADLVVFPGRHSVFWEQVTGQGIPMIVKDWPGTHHVDLGGNVLFLHEDSAKEIEEKIRQVAFDKEYYSKMKKVAEKKGMQVFSYREIAKRAIEKR